MTSIPDTATVAEPQPAAAAPATESAGHTWQPLRWLNIYRLVLAVALLAYLALFRDQGLIGERFPQAALVACVVYLIFSLAMLLTIQAQRPGFYVQVHFQIMVDIAFLTVLMHTSGGIETGLGMLIIIAVAGGAIVVPGRNANLFASLASLALLAEQVSAYLTGSVATNYPQAGLLGASFFATATLAYVLAHRVRESEALARQRGTDLANMAELNEYIIQQLDAGVIAVDHRLTVRLANRAAGRLLACGTPQHGQKLVNISPELATALMTWSRDKQARTAFFTVPRNGMELQPLFVSLGSHAESGTVIILEDISAARQQAQQMKLASLGRLTASIAHEIRNPLGAISHAGQLLQESADLPAADRRLTQIIRDHAARVNTIIENILQLSRREQFIPQDIPLGPWLRQFVHEFTTEHHLDPGAIRIEVAAPEPQVTIDTSQLRQILTNICENALRYCDPARPPCIRLVVAGSADAQAPFLDIVDNGPGISVENRKHIFEPFFTTEHTGTGLGLYICRELCGMNKASLSYFINDAGASCFRIRFAGQPQKRTP